MAKVELCHKGIQETSSSKTETAVPYHSFHPETTERVWEAMEDSFNGCML